MERIGVKNGVENVIAHMLNVKGTLNFGLVPQDLLILLNSYEMVNILHNSVSDNEFHALETKLRMTIIEGYEEYKYYHPYGALGISGLYRLSGVKECVI